MNNEYQITNKEYRSYEINRKCLDKITSIFAIQYLLFVIQWATNIQINLRFVL